jgi:DMSO/TMAO reductase YedYZ molybdopterin-dependent catalytic subunit
MKRIIPLLLVLLFLFTGCTAQEANQSPDAADTVTAATQAMYRENEITDYQGARLDPAIGPRDNSIKRIQQVDIASYSLSIDGLVDKQATLTYEQVRALEPYERLITLYCVEGWDATILWKGVLLDELINVAGAKPEAVTVIFGSVDGYTTSLPLQTISDKGLILAYSANGLDLPPAMGFPFIVVAEDKLGYKWGRWVDSITLTADADYRGYWEEAGYSNDANIPPK